MAESSDLTLKQFVAALIGLILGQIAGDKSIVLAKIFLYFWNNGQYQLWHVTQASLIIILLTAFIGVVVGVFMAKNRWADVNQIILSMATAILVATFSIIDQALPSPSDKSKLPFEETTYYVGWFIVLWLVSGILLPNPEQSFARRVRSWGGLMAVLSLMSGVSWILGALLIQVGVMLHKDILLNCSGGANFCDPRKFWLASPSILNPIFVALTMVALIPFWWNSLWKNATNWQRLAWTTSFSAFGIIYAGIFGGEFYAERGWARSTIDSHLADERQFFIVFGSIPATAIVVTVLIFLWTRTPTESSIGVGWPVHRAFYWLLPIVMGLGFMAVALLGFGPLVRVDGAHILEVWILAVGHGINGILFGLIFLVSMVAVKSFRPLLR